MPRRARELAAGYLDGWEAHAGQDAWTADWWALPGRVADALARILGAPEGSVSIQPSATTAVDTVLSCLDLAGPRRRLVTLAGDFPSLEYLLREQERLGAEVIVVEDPGGGEAAAGALLDALDERTALVACSHVSYLTSRRIDPVPLVERAHQVGALVLLDVYQSAGVLELDAAGWGADFLVGGTIKWLCGGPACGYLHVRPDLIPRLRPRRTGWIAHANPFRFAGGPLEPAANVRRFAQGTPSIPGLATCLAGLDLIGQVGLPTIAAESRRRTAWMVREALARGWPLVSPPEEHRRGGSVMLQVGGGKEAVARLARRGLFVDARPGGVLRASPHFFNTDEEVEEAMEVLATVMDEGRP